MARTGIAAWLPKFGRGSFALFLTVAVVSVLLADRPPAAYLLLTPNAVLSDIAVWQPLTANLIYPDGSLGLLFGTLIIQWFLGSELEHFWGTRKYLVLVAACGVTGHLASVLAGALSQTAAMTPVGGATAMDLAAVTAFGVVFGKRPLRLLGAIPLSSRGLAILVIALSLLSPLARGAPWPVVLPWLVAIAAALLVTTQPWRRLRDSGKLGGRKRKRKRKSHLRVVEPDPKLLN